jgi:anti-sigma factor RsiW
VNHPSTDELELLALGRMAPAKGASIMRHIDRCARCAKSYQKSKEYVAAMRPHYASYRVGERVIYGEHNQGED